jgi:uncharacterized linocin/CFP29 family protein
MSEYSDQVCWTEDQWSLVRKTVAEEAQKARVAAQFLPLYGPVDPTAVAVPNFRLSTAARPGPPLPPPPPRRLEVDSTPGTFLACIEVQVALANREMADPELGAALAMFRRAAAYVARVEDALVFNGQPGPDLPPRGGLVAGVGVWNVTAGGVQDGLLPPIAAGIMLAPVVAPPRVGCPIPFGPTGHDVFNAVVAATNGLETGGHPGPFACVLAPLLFAEVCTPNPSFVLPRDRILPLLEGGPLLRSSTIPPGFGVVLALGGSPVELVVAHDISVRFLQTTLEPRCVFRVSERIVLRIKELGAIAVLHP